MFNERCEREEERVRKRKEKEERVKESNNDKQGKR